MKKKHIILGIETSCDETAASIIQENEDENVKEKVELRLDRLSITLQVKDKETQKGILGAFYTAAGNTSEYVNLSSSGKRYKVNISAYLGPNHSHVLYQAAPKNKKDAFVRIEFNPAKLGPAGIADMKADLATLLRDEEISFELSPEDCGKDDPNDTTPDTYKPPLNGGADRGAHARVPSC